MTSPTTKNLYQRRNAAKKQVYEHEFSKVKTGGLQYAYMPIESIKPIVEKAYNDNGIVIDIIGLEHEDVREPEKRESTNPYGDKSSSTWLFVRGTLTIKLVNIDDPGDSLTIPVVGEAKDNSDKVINKVYTAALKNFYKIEFNISEGPKDDTDAIQTDADLEKPQKAVGKKAEARPIERTLEGAIERKIKTNDPFFKPVSKPSEEDSISDAQLNTGLLRAAKDPRFAEMIGELVLMNDVSSVTQLSRETRLVLMKKIEGESA